jgi:hypothetical protein
LKLANDEVGYELVSIAKHDSNKPAPPSVMTIGSETTLIRKKLYLAPTP